MNLNCEVIINECEVYAPGTPSLHNERKRDLLWIVCDVWVKAVNGSVVLSIPIVNDFRLVHVWP